MDAFGIAKSAEIPYNLMKAMFGKLKESAKNLIDGWLEDEFSGGGGYNPYTKSPFHMTRGWTPSGHAGIDYGAPTGTPIPSPIDGKVIQSWFSPNHHLAVMKLKFGTDKNIHIFSCINLNVK